MKTSKLLFALLLIGVSAFGQMTKNLGSFTFKDGTEIKEGSTVELLNGKNPQTKGVYLWAYEGGSMPIPKTNCDQTFDGKQFTVTKVISLKGMEKEDSIIAVFEIGKKKYYCFVTQGLKEGELKFF